MLACFSACEHGRVSVTQLVRCQMVNTTPADVAGLPLLQKMGCTLGVIDRFAYPGLPDETQLLWWRALASDGFPR